MNDMKTITLGEVQRLSFCNSKDLTKVIASGRVMEWVGIGFVDCGEATVSDIRKYPTVIAGK